MNLQVVGKDVVNTETGELVPLIYEVFSPLVSAEDKRYYSATSIAAHDCTDPEQLADVMKYTTDMRGVKVKSELTWFKKENDYLVRTLKQKPLISNNQYAFLKQLVDCISFKNIILCKRSFLCKKLGIEDKNLSRKLNQVSSWVSIHPCKKGFIKLFVAPLIGYKGRGKGIPSCFSTFYTTDPQTQHNALYVPFVGPPAPYTGPVFDVGNLVSKTTQYNDNRLEFFDSSEDFTAGDWWDKLPKKNEAISVSLEKWFAQNVGKDISEYYNQTPSWINEELPEYDESFYYCE